MSQIFTCTKTWLDAATLSLQRSQQRGHPDIENEISHGMELWPWKHGIPVTAERVLEPLPITLFPRISPQARQLIHLGMAGSVAEAEFPCSTDRLTMQLRKTPREADWIWWLLTNLPKL